MWSPCKPRGWSAAGARAAAPYPGPARSICGCTDASFKTFSIISTCKPSLPVFRAMGCLACCAAPGGALVPRRLSPAPHARHGRRSLRTEAGGCATRAVFAVTNICKLCHWLYATCNCLAAACGLVQGWVGGWIRERGRWLRTSQSFEWRWRLDILQTWLLIRARMYGLGCCEEDGRA
jgi:hypothetical protein